MIIKISLPHASPVVCFPNEINQYNVTAGFKWPSPPIPIAAKAPTKIAKPQPIAINNQPAHLYYAYF